jgi:hypothetical protein
MYTLKVSNNLGVSYKDLIQFHTLSIATEYLRTHKDELKKKRWIITDESGGLVLVCLLFEETAREVEHRHAYTSDDPYLQRYLSKEDSLVTFGKYLS